MPPYLIHVDSKILRLSSGKSFIIINVTPGIGGKSRGMNVEYAQGQLLGLGPGSEWEEHQMVLEAVGPELLQPLPPGHKTEGAECSLAEPLRCHGWDTGGPGPPLSAGPQQEVLAM